MRFISNIKGHYEVSGEKLGIEHKIWLLKGRLFTAPEIILLHFKVFSHIPNPARTGSCTESAADTAFRINNIFITAAVFASSADGGLGTNGYTQATVTA